MEKLKELYKSKLKFNCSYYLIKSKNSDLLVVFIGTDDFIISNHYYGCVAIGKRKFDFDDNKATYSYIQTCQSFYISSIEKALTSYERKRLQTNAKIVFEREKTIIL